MRRDSLVIRLPALPFDARGMRCFLRLTGAWSRSQLRGMSTRALRKRWLDVWHYVLTNHEPAPGQEQAWARMLVSVCRRKGLR